MSRRRRPETFRLWRENLPAFELWCAVSTQWNIGPGGLVGLRYEGVRASPAFRALPASQREDVFLDVCTIERAYLSAYRERMRAQQA